MTSETWLEKLKADLKKSNKRDAAFGILFMVLIGLFVTVSAFSFPTNDGVGLEQGITQVKGMFLQGGIAVAIIFLMAVVPIGLLFSKSWTIKAVGGVVFFAWGGVVLLTLFALTWMTGPIASMYNVATKIETIPYPGNSNLTAVIYRDSGYVNVGLETNSASYESGEFLFDSKLAAKHCNLSCSEAKNLQWTNDSALKMECLSSSGKFKTLHMKRIKMSNADKEHKPATFITNSANGGHEIYSMHDPAFEEGFKERICPYYSFE